MARALITGIDGFTGQYLERELSRKGLEVFGTTNKEDHKQEAVYSVDLRNKPSVKRVIGDVKPDVVVHLAALSFVAHDSADELYQVNLIGTRNLLAELAAVDAVPQSVILASSANVYGNADADPIGESVRPSPINDYAISKVAMEFMAKLWMGRLPIAITRPFNYIGVGQSERFLVSKLIAHFKRRAESIELGNTGVSRDFTDVRDVARAYGALALNCPQGEILNICSGTAHSIADVIQHLKAMTGHQVRIETASHLVRENELLHMRGDNGKLISLVPGWDPRPLEETLKWMLSA